MVNELGDSRRAVRRLPGGVLLAPVSHLLTALRLIQRATPCAGHALEEAGHWVHICRTACVTAVPRIV